MRSPLSVIGFLAGLGLVIGLVLWSGTTQVLTILSTAGFSLLLVVLLAPPEQILASEAWRQLFPHGRSPAFWTTLRASWMGMAINALLPVATVGGEVVKARALVHSGTSLADAAAAALVDKAIQAIATLVWGIVGLIFLYWLTEDGHVLQVGLIGVGLLAVGIGGFVALQVSGGVSFLTRISGRLLRRLDAQASVDSAKRVDLNVLAIYQRPAALLRSLGLRLAGQIWLLSEVLLTAYLLGLEIGFLEALMLRALIGAVRGLSFVVPAGLGLQEGAYVALGALIGMSPDMMLALSLASRLREILPNLPALLIWQQQEGQRLWQTKVANLVTFNLARRRPGDPHSQWELINGKETN